MYALALLLGAFYVYTVCTGNGILLVANGPPLTLVIWPTHGVPILIQVTSDMADTWCSYPNTSH